MVCDRKWGFEQGDRKGKKVHKLHHLQPHFEDYGPFVVIGKRGREGFERVILRICDMKCLL